MFWVWLGLSIIAGIAFVLVVTLAVLYVYLSKCYMSFVIRVFEEKPLFIVPRGQQVPLGEEVSFPTADGLSLRGCYLRTKAEQRLGVILFGLEFGSNRWACVDYCSYLVENGFDVFAFESRGQGDSDPQPGYEPLQWVTDFEVRDAKAALAYLKSREDAAPYGVGFFGISKGGSAGLLAAADDSYVRCFVTDGIFATYSTMVPYMRRWIAIVSDRRVLQKVLPLWYYGLFVRPALRLMREKNGCGYPHLEQAMARLAPRPLLMIHGGGDTYIKPEMAQNLFARAGAPKELWMVEKAKHNQALQVAGEEYRQRVLAFFEAHLAAEVPELVQVPTNVKGPHRTRREPVDARSMARERIAEGR